MVWGDGSMGGWMWLLMGAGTLAFWVAVVLIVRALLPVAAATRQPGRPDPLILLNERLARAEINAEEYERHRRLIVDGH